MHDDYDLRQEQLNKASLMSSKKFLENLLEKFVSNVVRVSASTSTNLFLLVVPKHGSKPKEAIFVLY